MATPLSSTDPPSSERNRRWLWVLLVCLSIWLWLWTFLAWEFDAPSAMYVIGNFRATYSALGSWLFASFYWVVGLSVVLALLFAWRGHFRLALAGVGLVLPMVLLTLWYFTEALPARSVVMRYLANANQQAQERKPGVVPAIVPGE